VEKHAGARWRLCKPPLASYSNTSQSIAFSWTKTYFDVLNCALSVSSAHSSRRAPPSRPVGSCVGELRKPAPLFVSGAAPHLTLTLPPIADPVVWTSSTSWPPTSGIYGFWRNFLHL
jgi:hypothetical protein